MHEQEERKGGRGADHVPWEGVASASAAPPHPRLQAHNECLESHNPIKRDSRGRGRQQVLSPGCCSCVSLVLGSTWGPS